MALQVKLLRVLQERQVVRLGSRRPIALDVRLVAATNIDLARAVTAQHFRADLYYRLSVAGVRLPSLHERQADIQPLAEHFIGVYCARLGIRSIPLSDDAIAALRAYSWPGNIRELENVIHYALIVCGDGVIRAGDFRFAPLSRTPGAATPPAFEPRPMAAAAMAVEEPVPVDPLQALKPVFDGLLASAEPQLFHRVEATLVRQAFAHCDDNQVQTARLLGITRNTLRTLLKRHGLLGGEAAAVEEEVSDGEEAAADGERLTADQLN